MYVNHYTLDCGDVIPVAAQNAGPGYEAGLIPHRVTVNLFASTRATLKTCLLFDVLRVLWRFLSLLLSAGFGATAEAEGHPQHRQTRFQRHPRLQEFLKDPDLSLRVEAVSPSLKSAARTPHL
jgi:hypothetical protein